jgi:hypothetical protein
MAEVESDGQRLQGSARYLVSGLRETHRAVALVEMAKFATPLMDKCEGDLELTYLVCLVAKPGEESYSGGSRQRLCAIASQARHQKELCE